MFLFAIVIGLLIGVVFGVPLAFRNYKKSERVDCPVCGYNSALLNGSSKCPKCKTRITRTSDGGLITHN